MEQGKKIQLKMDDEASPKNKNLPVSEPVCFNKFEQVSSSKNHFVGDSATYSNHNKV